MMEKGSRPSLTWLKEELTWNVCPRYGFTIHGRAWFGRDRMTLIVMRRVEGLIQKKMGFSLAGASHRPPRNERHSCAFSHRHSFLDTLFKSLGVTLGQAKVIANEGSPC